MKSPSTLRKARLNAGLTLVEAVKVIRRAGILPCSVTSLSRWETGSEHGRKLKQSEAAAIRRAYREDES